MFWTAFVTGVGISCGAGLFWIVILTMLKLLQSKPSMTQADINRLSLEALTERNELTRVTNIRLQSIVDAIDAS